MTTPSNTLPCGCERGQFHCPEAVSLWENTGRMHRQTLTSGNRDAYTAALNAYEAHFATIEQEK